MSAQAPWRLSVSLQNDWPIARSVADARVAEELGFAEVWINENGHHRGAFTQAAAIAAATSRIGIGIGVVNPFHRHPSVIAMEAASLDELSGGRVKLGLGASLWNLRNLGEADPRTAKPLTATVEAIRIIRALLRGEPGIESEIYTVSPEAKLDFEPLRRDLPLYVGAVNKRMMRAAGQWADAVELGAIVSLGYVRWALALIEEGARLGGRELAQLDIAAPLMTSVAADHHAARETVKEPLAYYLYRVEKVMTADAGTDPEAIKAVTAAVRDHGVEAGARLITDEQIDTFTLSGEPGHVAQRFSEYAAAGIQGLIAQVQGTERDESFRLLATEVLPAIEPAVAAA
jgi:5,10-methylenetetrahydromethanopterin reductase